MIETKLDGKTPDIAEENIAKLKEIFPDVFCEGKVDFEKLQQVLGNYIEDEDERYNFSWNGKGRSLRLAQSPSTGTLRPCKEESKDWDTTENLYVEGDNLEVLKLLQKSYHGKIKMIYIDPPYNTGHDFVYPDDYTDNMQNYLELTGQVDSEGKKITTNPDTNGRYHTDWLNMMYPRLRLARNLLADDGVIFISIDDNEVGNLKKICDEVFGEANFLSQLSIIVKTEGRQYGYFAKTHEYMLVYSKLNYSVKLSEIKIPNGEFKYKDNIGGFNTIGLRNRAVRIFNSTNRPNLRYPFYVDAKNKDEYGFSKVSTIPQNGWVEVFPSVVDGLESVWRWGKEKAENNKNELVACCGNDGETRIFKKDRDLTTLPKTVWFEKNFNSIVGTREVASVIGKGLFDFPKPLSLILRILEISSQNDDIVLDLFSGSATTAHAVMQLNAEDGGNRKFICVQLPEPTDKKSEAYKAGYKNICEIGKERIRRAGEKINAEIIESNKQIALDEEEKKLVDVGFKVFKLDTSNIKKWNPDFDNLEDSFVDSINNLVDGRSELDLVYEIMLKYGLDLTYPVEELSYGDKKIYSIAFGMLVICVAEGVSKDVADFIVEYKKQNNIEEMRTVFKDGCFKDDSTQMSIKETLKSAGIEEFITI